MVTESKVLFWKDKNDQTLPVFEPATPHDRVGNGRVYIVNDVAYERSVVMKRKGTQNERARVCVCVCAYTQQRRAVIVAHLRARLSAQHDNKTCKLPKFGGRHINSTFVMTPSPHRHPPLGFNMGVGRESEGDGAARREFSDWKWFH